MINIETVTHTFTKNGRALKVFNDLNMSVQKGSLVVVLGKSGCGKTTLLRLLAGAIKPSSGSITIANMSPEKYKKKSMVFQHPCLLPWRTAAQNVVLPTQIAGEKKSTKNLLKLVGLQNFSSFYPYELSGGMQQRVSLARALISKPNLLLLDEPFAALDAFTRKNLNNEFKKIVKNLNLTCIFITHSIQEALLLNDRLFLLRDGGVQELDRNVDAVWIEESLQ